jgi:hypothetical protein
MDKSEDLAAHLAASLMQQGILDRPAMLQEALENAMRGLHVTREVEWAHISDPAGTPNKIVTTLRFVRDQTPEELAEATAEAAQRFAASTWEPQDGPPPKGVSADQILDQDMWWTPKEGAPVKLADMGPGHCKNTLAWLERRAATLKFSEEMSFIYSMPSNPSDSTADAMDREMDALQAQGVTAWFEDKELVKALRKLIAADES